MSCSLPSKHTDPFGLANHRLCLFFITFSSIKGRVGQVLQKKRKITYGILKNESPSSIHLVGAVDRQSLKKRKAVFSLNEFSFTFSTKAEENHLSPLTSEHFKPLTAAEIDKSPLTVKHH